MQIIPKRLQRTDSFEFKPRTRKRKKALKRRNLAIRKTVIENSKLDQLITKPKQERHRPSFMSLPANEAITNEQIEMLDGERYSRANALGHLGSSTKKEQEMKTMLL